LLYSNGGCGFTLYSFPPTTIVGFSVNGSVVFTVIAIPLFCPGFCVNPE